MYKSGKIIKTPQKCEISWNNRGLNNKNEDLLILTKQLDPFCTSNHETKMKIDKSIFFFKKYVFREIVRGRGICMLWMQIAV